MLLSSVQTNTLVQASKPKSCWQFGKGHGPWGAKSNFMTKEGGMADHKRRELAATIPPPPKHTAIPTFYLWAIKPLFDYLCCLKWVMQQWVIRSNIWWPKNAAKLSSTQKVNHARCFCQVQTKTNKQQLACLWTAPQPEESTLSSDYFLHFYFWKKGHSLVMSQTPLKPILGWTSKGVTQHPIEQAVGTQHLHYRL